MEFRLLLFLLLSFISGTLLAPLKDESLLKSKRDVHEILEQTAKTAESFGQKALKYLIPETEKSGLAVLKPFLKKRHVKRAAFSSQQYNWPYNGLTNTNARSAIAFPSNYAYRNGYWNMNNWRWPVQRSVIPGFMPQNYYQQPLFPSSNVQARTLNDKEATTKTDDANAKSSLNDFRELITDVDSALVSFSDKSGVALKENLKGFQLSSKKRAKIENSKKRSKSPKKVAKQELKKITDTFTDFICGDAC